MTAPGDSTTQYNLLFFGTPEFAVPSLRALASDERYHIKAVITQPDRPAHRGQKLSPPAVKETALELGLSVFQPKSLKKVTQTKDGNFETTAKSCEAFVSFLNGSDSLHAAVAIAYGKIIPPLFLNLPKRGIINLHPSALPRWRGAAPLQHTIFSGDRTTEMCIMQIDEGLDTGPVFQRVPYILSERETLGSLHNTMAEIGAAALLDSLPSIITGSLPAVAQTGDGATYAEKWERDDARIRWDESAEVIDRRIRASSPFPGARTSFREEKVKIHAAAPITEEELLPKPPGEIAAVDARRLVVAAGEGSWLGLEEIQFPGKKRCSVSELLSGYRFEIGERFS